jgi:cell filamentation protein
MSEDPYVYPGTNILRNKLGIHDADLLDFHERELATQRGREGFPKGNFDLKHLQAIHRHLFQDVYDWAGEIRTVEISKGGSQFQLRQFIGTGMTNIHRRLVAARYFVGTNPEAFSREAGAIIGDLNYVHPFREGNGRTQLQYLRLLAERAKHTIDLTRLAPEEWIAASREAHLTRYDRMADCIGQALQHQRARSGRSRQEGGRER